MEQNGKWDPRFQTCTLPAFFKFLQDLGGACALSAPGSYVYGLLTFLSIFDR